MDSNKSKSIFSVVEIEINSLCNRKCSYCPVAILPVPVTQKYMALELFRKIMNELGEMNYSGILSYHFYNEPLIRKDLDQLVRIARKKVPKAFQLLYTNGDFLNDEKYQLLLEAGINHFLVTRHDSEPIKNRLRQSVQYPYDLELTNRGGIMKNIAIIEKALSTTCFSPEDNLIITSSGDVVLCSEDAKRIEVFGNVSKQSIEVVWECEKFVQMRKKLKSGDRNGASKVCSKCSSNEYSSSRSNYSNQLIAK